MRVSEQYILEHFEEAVETGRIKAFFQPIIRTMTGCVCCAEALARWEDETYGLLSPADFIPVLERHDLMRGETRTGQGFNREAFPENTCVNPENIPDLFQSISNRPTNKLFRRSFIEENALRFSET